MKNLTPEKLNALAGVVSAGVGLLIAYVPSAAPVATAIAGVAGYFLGWARPTPGSPHVQE